MSIKNSVFELLKKKKSLQLSSHKLDFVIFN